ncbi:MAG TPA: ABC transporter permease, partial [Balneolales bacterium]|nr:ABC transporter permease [Balneolales bacterium]
MFRNYLKIAIRNLWRNKTITAIKLAGLIAGFTGVILIIAYVRFELSFDRFNTKASRIYRIEMKITNKDQTGIATPSSLARTLKQDIPQIESSTILSKFETSVRSGDHVFSARILSAGDSVFSIFTLPLLEGNPKTALSNPYTAVISQAFAKRVFGSEDPVNKSIIIASDEKHPFLITGVMKDIPVNSHFHGDIVESITQARQLFSKLNWNHYTGMPQYVLLAPNTKPASVEQQIAALHKKDNIPTDIHLFLMPLTKIHLYSHLPYELEQNGDIRYIYIFSIIALLILGIACVNFINLTTASYLKRTKEVGVRKVLGANNRQLRIQFLSEGVILFFIAIVISIVLAYQVIPWFGSGMGIPVTAHSVVNKQTILYAFSLGILSVIGAGFYPAIFLSRLSPSLVLRGASSTGRSHIGIRKFLVLTQFVISIALVIATIFIYDQLHYIHTKDLGFNDSHVLLFPGNIYRHNLHAFKNELSGYHGIVNMCVAGWDPMKGYGGGSSWTDDKDSTKIYDMHMITGDLNFIKTLQIPLVKGRDFSGKYGVDKLNADSLIQIARHADTRQQYFDAASIRSILLNQTAVKELGLKNPVGKRLKYQGLQGTVIGIVKDFNGLSLRKHVGPVAIYGDKANNFGRMFIRIQPDHEQATISYIRKVWKENFPGMAFNYSFLDQYINSQYKTSQRLGDLCMAFTLLAILISCLGLFGLALFDTERRTKEIAIR